MSKVSVDLNVPSPYIECDTQFHRFKRRLTYAFALKLIKQFVRNSSVESILEIGTGSGFFLSSCHDQFPGVKLSGVEYDQRLLDVTKLRAPYAKCIQGNAETFNLQSEKFDVIVSFQVIEHLYNPSEMLNRVREHLNPGGLFIVTSPNLASIGAKVMGSKWHGYRDDHVSLKSSVDWVTIIEGHGFKAKYAGTTFFSGIPLMNVLPFGVFNWALLVLFGSVRWHKGESFVGAFIRQ
jgi:2-polyprenyl-3-methyl-5-hydroxy-6-metoxy-1,4-benzoquinol methylase